MLEKVRERGIQDPLMFHKIGLALGSLIGFAVGMFISDRAEEVEIEEIIDDPKEGPVGQPTE